MLRRHPLFSLLALLLEKCEQATQGYIPSNNSPNSSSTSSPNGSTNNNENDSFSRDIQVSFASAKKPFAIAFIVFLLTGVCTAYREGETSIANQQCRARWIDDQSSPSSSHSFVGAREGSRVMSRLLHSLHCLSSW